MQAEPIILSQGIWCPPLLAGSRPWPGGEPGSSGVWERHLVPEHSVLLALVCLSLNRGKDSMPVQVSCVNTANAQEVAGDAHRESQRGCTFQSSILSMIPPDYFLCFAEQAWPVLVF